MAITDRRAGRERREIERFDVNIEIELQSSTGKKSGTISDISEVGCFILSSCEVEDDEIVRIFFPLTDGKKIELLGEVSNHVFEVGFAAKFIELTAAQKEFLEIYVDMLRED